ncbi:helix-turn-helix domain-containing protein [Flexivirga oryzae]|uniref:Transcriptional regulator with XRE-family HTH domain n=1 Tax=Flexivirga oryzae TaxID=1794944 RepID=A0A839MYH7_9MICO|nr:XRE family transcriptional regulator [Flexivirga oryzae]MBB2890510.1 transcriptional regulator with XRE-family HTH domain [Flexivirga oryzae]
MTTAGSTISASVGAQIRLRREQRGMSAAELARRSNLSKATLSSLESGRSNPTIDTLDAVAIALGIPLADLLVETTLQRPQLVRATEAVADGPQRELLRRVSGGHQVEIWRLRLPPHTGFDGVPHATGTLEHLMVASGTLSAGPADGLVELGQGDLLAFPGDVAHSYRTGSAPAELTVIIASPVIG